MATTSTSKQMEIQNLKRMARGDTFKTTFNKRLTELRNKDTKDDEKNFLKIIYGNVRGFTTNKYGRLKEETMLAEANLKMSDIIIATEAGYVNGAQRHLKGYKQVGNTPIQMGNGKRKNTRNGGVCMWIRKDSNFSVLASQTIDEVPNLQAILVILRGNIRILAFYRSPNQTAQELKRTIEMFEKLENKTCIVGDLNIDANWDEEIVGPTNMREQKTELITKIGKETGRRQVVDFPTNLVSGTTIDVCIVPTEWDTKCLNNVVSPGKIKDTMVTDHEWFTIEIKNVRPSDTIKRYNKRTKVDFEKASKSLEGCENSLPTEQSLIHSEDKCGVCELLRQIKKSIENATTTTVMKNKRYIASDGMIANQLLTLKRIERIKHVGGRQKEAYDRERKIFLRLINENVKAKRRIFQDQLENNPRALYDPLGKQAKGQVESLYDKDGNLQTDPKQMAEIMAEFLSGIFCEKVTPEDYCREVKDGENAMVKFVSTPEMVREAIKGMKSTKSKDPNGLDKETYKKLEPSISKAISKLANQSFERGLVPECLKISYVMTIPKGKQLPNRPENCRPINLTPIMLKVWEKVVKAQLYPKLEKDDFFDKSQHGYREGFSTKTCLTKINRTIQESIADGFGAIGVLIDFSKAFDTLEFNALLRAIRKTGAACKAFDWIGSWCKDTNFRCQFDKKLSDPRPVKSGSRQGTTVGPLAFTIFINELLEALNIPGVTIGAYADDITMIIPKTKDKKHVKITQTLLDICTKWSDKTGLKFNVKKCNVINLGRSSRPKEDFYLMDEKLEFVEKAKVLGIVLKANTNKKVYEFNHKKATANGNLVQAQIKTFFKGSTFKTMKKLYQTYFTSKALYASEIVSDVVHKKEMEDEKFGTETPTFPPWIKRLDKGFKKLFWNVKPTVKDMEKEFTVPAMPSQLCVIRDLELILQILTNDYKRAGLSMEECLPINEHKKRSLRSDNLSRFKNSMNQGGHDNKMSVFKRQQYLLEKLLEHDSAEGILLQKRKIRKKTVENYVLNVIKTKQNAIREEIKQGTLKNPNKIYHQH